MVEYCVRERLIQTIRSTGAVAVGVARAELTEESENRRVDEWVASGMHAGMSWMERHALLRRDLNNVLPGVRSVVCAAYPYAPTVERPSELPYISRYAYNEDYHESIRARLRAVLSEMGLDAVCRICIDSAPVSERYWAVRAGIGYRGDNGALIVPGVGPEVFLAEILTTLDLEPDAPGVSTAKECLHCGACHRACPTGALQQDGTIDCRRCISYLTIEHRGPWTEPEAVAAMSTPAGRHSMFGCDRCITVCPLSRLESYPESRYVDEPLPQVLSLTSADFPATPAEFKARFRHTALLRPGIDGLLRNLANLKPD